MSTPSRESDHDLLWQAFCYANDELTPAEAAAFEERLALDQAACEAVARAVEVCETVRAVPQEVPAPVCVSSVRAESTWMQPVGWLALGAAACLAAVMAFQTWQPGAGATTAKAGDANLALAWAEAQAELPHDVDYTDADIADAGDADPMADEGVEAADADDTGHVPPSWMLAALSDGPAFIDPVREN